MADYGVDGFVAHTTIEPTSEWIDVIQLALRTCHAMVAMLTDDFATSRWCDQEVGFCVGRGILIVPVRMGIDPYGFIGRYQGLTPSSRSLIGLPSQIFDLLARHPLTGGEDGRSGRLAVRSERFVRRHAGGLGSSRGITPRGLDRGAGQYPQERGGE
jgi:hypothetical protein